MDVTKHGQCLMGPHDTIFTRATFFVFMDGEDFKSLLTLLTSDCKTKKVYK